jgi:hypothetical protein
MPFETYFSSIFYYIFPDIMKFNMSQWYQYNVTVISIQCHNDINTMSVISIQCHSDINTMSVISIQCHSVINTMSRWYQYNVTVISIQCHSDINTMSHYKTVIICLYHACCLIIEIIVYKDQKDNIKSLIKCLQPSNHKVPSTLQS